MWSAETEKPKKRHPNATKCGTCGVCGKELWSTDFMTGHDDYGVIHTACFKKLDKEEEERKFQEKTKWFRENYNIDDELLKTLEYEGDLSALKFEWCIISSSFNFSEAWANGFKSKEECLDHLNQSLAEGSMDYDISLFHFGKELQYRTKIEIIGE